MINYNTTTKTFDDTIAILIYYNNTKNGVAYNTSTSSIAYNSNNHNYEGPVTAMTYLPTTTQWSNISLSNTSRAIINQTGGTTATVGTLPTDYSYAGYAARLLTAQELLIACGKTTSNWTLFGSLNTCKYLMENTKYSETQLIGGYWLETPNSSHPYNAWYVLSRDQIAGNNSASISSGWGVRPVIEVLESDISY